MSEHNNGTPRPGAPVVATAQLAPQDAMVCMYCDLASHTLIGMAKQLEVQVGRPEMAQQFAAAAAAFIAMRDKFVAQKNSGLVIAQAVPPPRTH